MGPEEIALLSMWMKFFTDIAIDAYIEAQQKNYTPDQLKAMVESEQYRKTTLDAAWQQMKTNAGL